MFYKVRCYFTVIIRGWSVTSFILSLNQRYSGKKAASSSDEKETVLKTWGFSRLNNVMTNTRMCKLQISQVHYEVGTTIGICSSSCNDSYMRFSTSLSSNLILESFLGCLWWSPCFPHFRLCILPVSLQEKGVVILLNVNLDRWLALQLI